MKVVFLPEAFDYIATCPDMSIGLAEPLDGPRMTKYRQLAKDNDIWLSLGGFHEKVSRAHFWLCALLLHGLVIFQGPPDDSRRIYISHVIVDNAGTIVATYRKSHLFEGNFKNKFTVKEIDWVIPGKEVVPPVETPAGKVGLEIVSHCWWYWNLSIVMD